MSWIKIVWEILIYIYNRHVLQNLSSKCSLLLSIFFCESPFLSSHYLFPTFILFLSTTNFYFWCEILRS